MTNSAREHDQDSEPPTPDGLEPDITRSDDPGGEPGSDPDPDPGAAQSGDG